MSHNPRWVRLSRGGGGVYTVGVGCPPWLIFPVIRNAGLLSHRTYRGRVATRGRHEAARGVHAALQDDEGDEEGRRAGPWINRRRGH